MRIFSFLIKKILPRGFFFPILSGQAKGIKWFIHAGILKNIIGSYEYKKQNLVKKLIKPGDIVYDIGSHAGFYTLIFSRFVGRKGLVYSFEPNYNNIQFLCKHLKINTISNVQVYQVAVGESSKICSFEDQSNSFMGKVVANAYFHVPMINIDSLIQDKTLRVPRVIKIDVEGYELAVLRGMKKLLLKKKPKLLVALDNKSERGSVIRFLREVGYSIEFLAEDEIFAR